MLRPVTGAIVDIHTVASAFAELPEEEELDVVSSAAAIFEAELLEEVDGAVEAAAGRAAEEAGKPSGAAESALEHDSVSVSGSKLLEDIDL